MAAYIAMASLASSEGWKFMTPSGSQRRAPLTPLPTCGISTIISSASAMTKILGAWRSQKLTGTITVIHPASRPIAMNRLCRTKKCIGAYFANLGLSGSAIDAE